MLRLCEDRVEGKHKVFFDNLFASPELMKYLLSQGIYAVATLRANRSRNCPVSSEKDLKKNGRGAMEEVVETEKEIVTCAWFDNRRVMTVSNFAGVDPTI